MVFTILTSLPTASITLLKQPYYISTITGSMPLDHRSCHVFASAAVDTTDCNMLITCLHLDWEFTPAVKLVEVLPIMPSNMTKWDIMFLQPANLTIYTIWSLFSLYVKPTPHLLSPQMYLPHYKSPTALSHMHHLTCGISSLLHSVNLILFTLLRVHRYLVKTATS